MDKYLSFVGVTLGIHSVGSCLCGYKVYKPVNPVLLRIINKSDQGRFFKYAWSKLFQVNGTTFCRTADRKHQDMTDYRLYHFLVALTLPPFFLMMEPNTVALRIGYF